MTNNRTSSPDTDPLPVAQARAQEKWARVAGQLREVAPSDIARLALTVLVAAAIVGLAVASWPALLPFVIGGFVVYLLLPIVNALDRVMPRALAALLTLAGFVALVAWLAYLLIPVFTVQLVRLYQTVLNPDALAGLSARLDRALLGMSEPAQSMVREYLDKVGLAIHGRYEAVIAGLATASVTNGLALVNTLGAVIGLVLLPLWMLAIMIGQRSAGQTLRRVLPGWVAGDLFALLRIVDRALGSFVRGQLVLGIAVGITLYAEVALLEYFTAFDARYPVLMAVIAGLTQLVPQIGPLLGLILFGLFGLGISPQAALIAVALYAGANVLVSNLVAPRLQRRLNDLNPALLVLLVAALSQFGLVWVLLSAPILAIARDLLRYAYGRIADPPRPAGLLPGQPLPRSAPGRGRRAPLRPAQRVPSRHEPGTR